MPLSEHERRQFDQIEAALRAGDPRFADAAASSRSVAILAACLLAALTIGLGVAFWLVRSIPRPVARLVAIVGRDLPS